MDAINKDARVSAIQKFIGVYAGSLLVVIIISYFLFTVPAGIFKEKVELYKTTEKEQASLMTKIDGATTGLNKLVQTDKEYLSSRNDIEKGNLQTQLDQYQKDISNFISDVQRDSMNLISPLAKRNSYNYITAYTTILSYRNTIAQLQNSLLARGGDANELIKVQAALQACNTQLEIAKLTAAANARPAAPAGGGGGGTNNAKEAQLQAQLQRTQEDLETCKKEKLALQSARPSAGTAANLSDVQKASLLFETGEELYNKAQKTKNLIEKRGILSSAKDIFEKSGPNYPDVAKVKNLLKKIEDELKKLYNMG